MAFGVAFEVPQVRDELMFYYTHSFIHRILPEYLGAADIKLSFTLKLLMELRACVNTKRTTKWTF